VTFWVNGVTDGTIDHRDRGLQYGDGLFETMRVHRGTVRLLDHHLERLADGCKRLGIAVPGVARLRRELSRAAAPASDAVLKLIITRGVGRRGYRPTGDEKVTRIVSLYPLSRKLLDATATPARVRLCRTRLGANEALAGLKTLNRLESVLARAEWRDPRIWEGLMRDADGAIVCGTMSNLFIRTRSQLATPLLDRCGVAGVMRRWVLEQAGALELQTCESRLRWEDVAGADEVFMTNAVAGVVPVAALLNGRTSVRPLHQRTAHELRDLLESL
jgi:4-amino-4-deoxychorismate lyase